jgi:hypothetical protein
VVVLNDVVAPHNNHGKIPETEVQVRVLATFNGGAAPRDGVGVGCPDLGMWVDDGAAPRNKS